MDLTASVFLLGIAAVIIAGIWYLAVRTRAAAAIEMQQQYAETQRVLADISAQLADLNRRTADMQRILKDAE
jgi:type VI protein secretion system component VasK